MTSELDSSHVPVLKERIFDVLKESDLSSVSAKKVRMALADMPEGSLPSGIDLSAQKKAIDSLIRVCYDEVTQKKPSSKASNGEKKTTKSTNSSSSSTKKSSSKKRSKKDDDNDDESQEPKKKRTPNANNPLNRPLRLSSDMAEVCGGSEMPRFEVVKKLWVYIKDHNLQNESNKRQVCHHAHFMKRTSYLHVHLQIMCDDKLTGLFGKSSVEYVFTRVCTLAHFVSSLPFPFQTNSTLTHILSQARLKCPRYVCARRILVHIDIDFFSSLGGTYRRSTHHRIRREYSVRFFFFWFSSYNFSVRSFPSFRVQLTSHAVVHQHMLSCPDPLPLTVNGTLTRRIIDASWLRRVVWRRYIVKRAPTRVEAANA